jgi:hypothetical protein
MERIGLTNAAFRGSSSARMETQTGLTAFGTGSVRDERH